MIYLSSAAIRRNTLSDAVKELAQNGIRHIELTAGNPLTENWLTELLELKDKYNLNYLCHNYFPVPQAPFVLNLASLDEQTHQRSVDLYKDALKASEQLGGDKYAIHAGFRMDVPLAQIGKAIDRIAFFPERACWDNFVTSVSEFYQYPSPVKRYIENNVLSQANYQNYEQQNPFYVTNSKGWFQLKDAVPEANLLLDVAHLKVSCQSLGLNFEDELAQLVGLTDYIHLSDNNGLSDDNQAILEDSHFLSVINAHKAKHNYTYTLEVYDDIKAIKKSMAIIEKVLS